ncbi:hypothetical protein CEXT_809181 [Caerostris extrusa]|uniref:Uncharacterized protein n=1 Tax=Caerostris extrusa TaxID=172846 RepID=A0AAV4MN45_CAEEX|nr:hypothetical protein CEXT_809181 [Caerostris extrusa]
MFTYRYFQSQKRISRNSRLVFQHYSSIIDFGKYFLTESWVDWMRNNRLSFTQAARYFSVSVGVEDFFVQSPSRENAAAPQMEASSGQSVTTKAL